ncbi:integrase catalytic subunit [Melioribacter roseus P3M-2]|uniref:Integrase catalytic subunit n=1 Tax=Melioribacter roseus (strain DSM 23840 / JCM 17771 / VKM B-2668 / P3M-2) TaxID=1191523 RepID=I6ZQ95_MELRP|nr:IS3 family transposase [Melioribacter roseus]AFN74244.1 integrase catalytic subunit [Melioribacter roseus P3M-2]
MIHPLTNISINKLIGMVGISPSKYYHWNRRIGQANAHNAAVPKNNWILEWEREAIINYAKSHIGEGYRRLTYMMLDENIVAVSPSTTYRVLKSAGLLNRWNKVKRSSKGNGFNQPTMPHQHWHIDIKYVNFKGTFLFLIDIIDGYSRFIVNHELRMNMQEYDVQITLQKALEKFPGVKPRIISDNGSQFISKDFSEYLRLAGLTHIKTSIGYPQSNGKIEKFHSTINRECLNRYSFIDINDAKKQIKNFIDYYNTKRLHSSLSYLTPEDLLLGRANERLRERKRKIQKAKLYRIEVRYAS